MKCPHCYTNVMGNNTTCPICGKNLVANNPQKETKQSFSNGLLDEKDLVNYTKNVEFYKQKKEEPNNIFMPICIILLILITLVIIGIFKLLNF